ncbi:hypothetical protein ACFFX0_16190 [Citricoccus parietis]|uniref:Uncharacterized protein n=1 Tax=Citricoccus parietis TaxID=592307 RepID=A0ABV5G146_9MICC
MYTVTASPPICRQACCGDSSTLRAATSFSAVSARRHVRRVTTPTSQGPMKCRAIIGRLKPTSMMISSTIMFAAPKALSTTCASARPATASTTRTQWTLDASWRVRTPRGVISIRRSPAIELAAAITSRAPTTAKSQPVPSHIPSSPIGRPANGISPTSGMNTR